MSNNTKKGPNLQKIQFTERARLFDELSITMYYCRLVLYIYLDFKEIISNFPPNEMEAERIYNLSNDRYYVEGKKDKCDEIFRIAFDSVKTKRFSFNNKQEKAFKDFVTDDRKFHFFNMIFCDLQKIPSPVDYSDESSFETLAIDCNDLSNFYFAADRIFWNVDDEALHRPGIWISCAAAFYEHVPG